MRRLTSLLAVLAIVVGACGDDTGSAETTTTEPPPTTATTAAPPVVTTTTTTLSSSTTTAGPETTTTAPGLYPPDPFEESTDGAAGSGCAPGSDTLPDGFWFGFATEVAEDTVTFDLACFYFGDIAWEKAAEVGEEAPNDFWISNDNPSLREIPVDSDATVWWIPPEIESLQPLVYFAEWPLPEDEFSYTMCPGDFCTVWLETTGGAVTEIVEQYLP